MIRAICVKCGVRKRAPYSKCTACGTDPSQDERLLVQSVYLSLGRYEETDRHAEYSLKLERMGSDLRAGHSIEFDSGEIQRLTEQLATFRSIPMSAVWGAVGRLFLPAVLLMAAMFGLSFLLRLAG